MKKYFGLVALVAAMFVAMPVQAQFQFGVKAGINVTKASFDKDVASADNRAGFFVGPMAEFTLPIIGLGVDAALLYNNKSIKATSVDVAGAEYVKSETLHYIDIPINVKYSIGLGSLASVYAATGPQFSFNIGSGNVFHDNYSLNDSEFSWNIGAGVKLLKHFQVGYNYNIALGHTAEMKDDAVNTVWGKTMGKDFKTNTHQISVAYMF